MSKLNETQLHDLLTLAETLKTEEEREAWLANLPPETREQVLEQARAYVEEAMNAASDHAWVATNVFDPMSKGEEPEKPIPNLKTALPTEHRHQHDE